MGGGEVEGFPVQNTPDNPVYMGVMPMQQWKPEEQKLMVSGWCLWHGGAMWFNWPFCSHFLMCWSIWVARLRSSCSSKASSSTLTSGARARKNTLKSFIHCQWWRCGILLHTWPLVTYPARSLFLRNESRGFPKSKEIE